MRYILVVLVCLGCKAGVEDTRKPLERGPPVSGRWYDLTPELGWASTHLLRMIDSTTGVVCYWNGNLTGGVGCARFR